MSFFNSFGGAKGVQAKKQEIRTVQRIITKPKTLPLPAKATKPARPSPATNSSTSTPRTTGSNSARSSPATSTSTTKRKAQTQDPDRASAIRRNNKRKLATPPGTPLFGSSSESESEDDGTATILASSNVKRIKSQDKVVDLNPRKLRDVAQWEAKEAAQETQHHLVHSADLTTGGHATKHTPLFGRSEEDIAIAELHYPGCSQPERFALVAPKDQTNHKPAGDLIDAIEIMLKYFFPNETSSALLNESTGIPYLMRRAHRTGDLASFQSALSTFNTLITTSRTSGTLASFIDTHLPSQPLPLDLTKYILDQCFSRTVSPHVDLLRSYASFSDSVYGEILPPFASQIFAATGLTHTSVFLDLGSGVGNVVLQAALETGCAAHGIEFEANPASLAANQAEEFRARCARYGIKPGPVNIMQGDFLEDARLRSLIPIADVILTNNYAFSSATNDRLRGLMLDTKEGARIVSLKSFVPSKWRLEERTSGDIAAVLKVERREFWRGSVSWTDREGEWFLQERDSGALKGFLEGGGAGRRERRG